MEDELATLKEENDSIAAIDESSLLQAEYPYCEVMELVTFIEFENPVKLVEPHKDLLPDTRVAVALLLQDGSKVSIKDQISYCEELMKLKDENVIRFHHG